MHKTKPRGFYALEFRSAYLKENCKYETRNTTENSKNEGLADGVLLRFGAGKPIDQQSRGQTDTSIIGNLHANPRKR